MNAESECGFTFKANRGWFEKFIHRSGIHSGISGIRHGEAASSNMEAAEKYVGEFRYDVGAAGYLPQQVLSCDETGHEG